MGTLHRRKRSEQTGRITADAIEAYRAGDVMALQRALRLPPWHVSPLRAVGTCPSPAGDASSETWPAAVALREQLEAAA